MLQELLNIEYFLKENLVKLKLNIFENLRPILGIFGKPLMKWIYGGDFIIFKPTLWEILNSKKETSLKIDLNKINFHNWVLSLESYFHLQQLHNLIHTWASGGTSHTNKHMGS
jgi:hypothetical protein